MVKRNLINDVAELTTIPKLSLEKIASQSMKCICHNVSESIVCGENEVEAFIGIGTLFIKIDGNDLKFRFQPNSKFEEMLIDTIENGESPVIKETEDILVRKIVHTYKDLFA